MVQEMIEQISDSNICKVFLGLLPELINDLGPEKVNTRTFEK